MRTAHLVKGHDRIGWFAISWYLYLATMLLSFFVMIEPAPTDLVFVVAFGALLLAGIRPGPVVGPIVTLGLIMMTWFVILSLVFATANPSIAIRAVATEIYLVLLFLTTAYFARHGGDHAFRLILTMFLIGGFITSVIGLLAYVGLMPNREIFFRDRFMLRIQSTFQDPNVLGPFLVVGTLFAFWLLVAVEKLRLWAGALFCVLLGCLITTYSRGAFINTALSLMVFGSCLLIYRKTRFNAILMVIAAVIALLVVMLAFGQAISDRVSGSTLGNRLSLQSYDNSRFDDIQATARYIYEYPLGLGPLQSYDLFGFEAHNTYILLGINSGIFALIGFAVLYFGAALRCLLKVYRQEDGWLKYGFVLAVLTGLFVLMNVVSALHWRHMWVVLGLAFGEYRSNHVFGDRIHFPDSK